MNLILLLFLFNIPNIFCLTWSQSFDNFPSSWKTAKIGGQNLLSIVKDPLNANVKVLKIVHPKGSCSSACGIPGGASITVKPFGNVIGNSSVFEFRVFFHNSFNYVKGGKLPGVHGGGSGCSGCNNNVATRNGCFSARFMWGKDGIGYPYLYLPLSVTHEADFCKLCGGSCNANCGLAFNKTKYFEKNKWTHVKQYIKMNTPGKKDGFIQVWVDGNLKVDYRKVIYRTKSSLGIDSFSIHPFFGGSGADWATPVDTYTLYKDFKFVVS